MATTTTNYGWDIPQSTDLVKDGATAIATLGQDIDTAFVDLKGGTTGQVLSKASGTDLDFTWVAQDDSNAIQNAIVDAKGDLIAATASDTPARLAVGTNGQVLTADSTASTGLSWVTPTAGSMTQLATGTFSNNALSITSISGSYKSLVLRMNNIYVNNQDFDFRFNGDTGNSYGWAQMSMNTTSIGRTNTTTSFQVTQPYIQNGQGPNFAELTIPDYANTDSWKVARCQLGGNAAGTRDGAWSIGTWSSTSAITSIQTRTAITSGSYILYGVN